MARTEGADASKRADEASTSYDSIKLQYSEAQSEAKEAATAAAAEVSSLQVSLCLFFHLTWTARGYLSVLFLTRQL